MNEISVSELARKHADGEDFLLLDVREPDELAIASIPWAVAIPMGEIKQRLNELPADKPIAVLCHSGGRSGRVAAFLNDNGYPQAVNVAGGIDAWSTTIDPSVPAY
ncbi:MAG TPA: rhodanese-like domain-containing protein [Candidatus Lustribacter sp.]